MELERSSIPLLLFFSAAHIFSAVDSVEFENTDPYIGEIDANISVKNPANGKDLLRILTAIFQSDNGGASKAQIQFNLGSHYGSHDGEAKNPFVKQLSPRYYSVSEKIAEVYGFLGKLTDALETLKTLSLRMMNFLEYEIPPRMRELPQTVSQELSYLRSILSSEEETEKGRRVSINSQGKLNLLREVMKTVEQFLELATSGSGIRQKIVEHIDRLDLFDERRSLTSNEDLQLQGILDRINKIEEELLFLKLQAASAFSAGIANRSKSDDNNRFGKTPATLTPPEEPPAERFSDEDASDTGNKKGKPKANEENSQISTTTPPSPRPTRPAIQRQIKEDKEEHLLGLQKSRVRVNGTRAKTANDASFAHQRDETTSAVGDRGLKNGNIQDLTIPENSAHGTTMDDLIQAVNTVIPPQKHSFPELKFMTRRLFRRSGSGHLGRL